MELRHRKNLIQFYIEMKVKTGVNVAPYLEKLTKDRFKYWNFEQIEIEIYRYYVGYLGAKRKDALNKLKELKSEI